MRQGVSLPDHCTNRPPEKVLSKLKKQKKQTAAVESAAESISEAVSEAAAPEAPAKKKKCRCRKLRRLFIVAVLGAIVAVVVSEDARKLALDALFGAEEEFEYTSHVSAPGSNGTTA